MDREISRQIGTAVSTHSSFRDIPLLHQGLQVAEAKLLMYESSASAHQGVSMLLSAASENRLQQEYSPVNTTLLASQIKVQGEE